MYNDGINLPEVENITRCSNKSWPRYYTHTLCVADPVKEAKNFTWHKMIVKTAGINAAWYHNPVSVQNGYSPSYQVPPNYGLTQHYRIPEIIPRRKNKRNFLMSRYFKETLTRLQKHC